MKARKTDSECTCDKPPEAGVDRRTFIKFSALAGTAALSVAATRSTPVERLSFARSRVRPGTRVALTIIGQWQESAVVRIVDAHDESLGLVLDRVSLRQAGADHWVGEWTVPGSLRDGRTSQLRRVVAVIIEDGQPVLSAPLEVVLTPLGLW